jgi:vancomycin resistance protein VanW
VRWRTLDLHPSLWHPLLYRAVVWKNRLLRAASWKLDGRRYADARSDELLPYRVFKHSSKLIRRTPGAALALQLGKVRNLGVAVPRVHGLLIGPGETFSFCRAVGPPTRARGFVEGMELSRGEARPGVGGGLCQLANLLHWMALHSPLKVVERHHHSFDPFPDDGRVLPFGSGATVFYNYVDLQLYNPTALTFQLRLWLTDKLVEGELRSTSRPPVSYHVVEREHRFVRRGSKVYRMNQLWREERVRGHGAPLLGVCFLSSNCAEVKYELGPEVAVDPDEGPLRQVVPSAR